jgi:putative transposase
MLIYEYKLDGNKQQYAAIDEAIRVVQFIRNKCIRLWMDGRRINKNDLQCSCAILAKEYSFANCLNSQARQSSADRAWAAISRFYENCRNHKPGKKGYPKFQHDNRSVEYKQTGWLRFVCPETVKTGEGQQRERPSADNWEFDDGRTSHPSR